jgi:hypothetical protein
MNTTNNKHGVPGKAESLWISESAGSECPALSRDIAVDVAIVVGRLRRNSLSSTAEGVRDKRNRPGSP